MRAVTARIQQYCRRGGGKRLLHSLVTLALLESAQDELVDEYPHSIPLFSRQQDEERTDWRDEGGKTASFSALASKWHKIFELIGQNR